MKCAECPLSLACFSGHLDDGGQVTLCRRCRCLEVHATDTDKPTVYLFKCEQRQYRTRIDIVSGVLRSRSYSNSEPIPYQISDIGPGLQHSLNLFWCVQCKPLIESVSRTTPLRDFCFLVIDLDEEVDAAKEAGTNPLELKH